MNQPAGIIHPPTVAIKFEDHTVAGYHNVMLTLKGVSITLCVSDVEIAKIKSTGQGAAHLMVTETSTQTQTKHANFQG